MGLFSKIVNGLKKTKDALTSKIATIFTNELDDDFYDDLEYMLVSSDIGGAASMKIVEDVKQIAKKQKIKTEEDLKVVLKEIMLNMINFDKEQEEYPLLINVVGVNGVGKTTSIGKMAHIYKENGKKVLMVAGDTFRAAASDQLTEWSKRVNCRIVKYNEGVDPGAVVFDGIASAKAKGDDVVLVDTAGRLHNKANLMDELKKISKIVDKEWEGKVLNYLVIDATTGQNALSQVKTFNEIIGLDCIILTKLDGTAKGGIVFAIAKEYGIPVRFVGLGEGIDDLQVFNAKEFVDNLL